MAEPLFCKMYIDVGRDGADLTVAELRELVAYLVGGRVVGFAILTELCTIDLSANSDFPGRRDGSTYHDFISFRYYADIEPREGVERDAYVALVADLLRRLWSLGHSAVAACRFEDELPLKAGLARG